jgi:hypothetical protein
MLVKRSPPSKTFDIFLNLGERGGESIFQIYRACGHEGEGGDHMSRKISTQKQDELIAAEIEKWNSLLIKMPANKKEAAAVLVERVAFMTVTLQILEADIKAKGPTYRFVNGSQKMHVENPSQKSYNTMINRYTAACDKLLALVPNEPANLDQVQAKKQRSAVDLI